MISEADYRGVDPDRATDRTLAWKLRQPAVPAILAAARLAGGLTASQRCLPDYLVIGGKRTGSTTLARSLAAADDVLALFPRREDRKGKYYFDVHHERGQRWYLSHFPLERTRRAAASRLDRPVAVGEASPYYLQHPHAPARAAELLPRVRVVAVVREPVERAYSHWRERVRQGLEPLATFEQAVQAEPERLAGEWDRMLSDPSYVSLAHLNHGYLAQSMYSEALGRWQGAMGADRLLVVHSDDLFADPTAVVARVRRFLGLDPGSQPAPRHFNRLPGDDLDRTLFERLGHHFRSDQESLARWLGPSEEPKDT